MSDETQRDPDRDAPVTVGRRTVLFWLSLLPAVAGTILAAIPGVGFLFSPLIRKKDDEWVDAGPVKEYPTGQTRLIDLRNPLLTPWSGETAKEGAYVRRSGEDRFDVLSFHCAHLGCPVRWFPDSGLFMCPCHGGIYYENGDYAAGPPPRGLFRLEHRIVQGRLQIKVGHFPTLAEPA